MNNPYVQRSQEIAQETISNRRTFHAFAETGFDLPQTVAYVMEKICEMGVEPTLVGKSGVTCTIGKKEGKTILLRGDMDALPMPEETGLDFAATNGSCHSCGHDSHTAMLLSAVKLLKEREDTLAGKVKFMFQPAEEILGGALDMVANGILDGVDMALGMHIAVATDDSPYGNLRYCAGPATFSADAFDIHINGLAAHGSTPELGLDAITIASHIVINLQEVLAREISCFDNCVLLVGTMEGGTTCNTVPGTAKLGVTTRTTTFENRAFLNKRVEEIATQTAALFRGTATVDHLFGTPPMVNDAAKSRELAGYAAEILGAEHIVESRPICGGEDFAYVCSEVPSAFFNLCAGSIAQGYTHGLHHPKMTFNEDILPVGAAVYAHVATAYLANN